jgi:hypothetical protein
VDLWLADFNIPQNGISAGAAKGKKGGIFKLKMRKIKQGFIFEHKFSLF